MPDSPHKLATSDFLHSKKMFHQISIIGKLALFGLVALGCAVAEAQAAQRCSLNLFQERASAGCADQDSSGSGLFSMYSKVPAPKPKLKQKAISAPRSAALAPLVPSNLPSVGSGNTQVQLMSTNSELSHKGPNANAKLVGGCDGAGSARLLLEFPGYPLFIGNDQLQLAVHGGNGRGISLVSSRGTDFTELAINGRQVISGLSAIAAKRGTRKLIFKLKDQDGLKLTAKFDAQEFREKMEHVLSTCRRI